MVRPAVRATLRRALPAWLVLVVIASLANIGAWTVEMPGSVRIVSNVAWLFGLPGWVPIYAVGVRGARSDPTWIFVANGAAWAFWILCAVAILRCRVWLRAGHTGRSRASEPDAEPNGKPDPSRRAFLFDSSAGLLAVGFAAAPGYGAVVEPQRLTTRRYTVPIAGLPAGLVGLRLVQFADPHLGPRVTESFVAEAVRRAIELQPDVVVFNGDYVADGVGEIDRVADLMKPLADAARIGAVGVLGNHDWWGDGPRMRDAMRRVGVRMIDNDRVWIDAGAHKLTDTPSPDGLALVGLGDLTEDVTDFDRAFDGVETRTPRVVVAHQPDSAELPEMKDPDGPRVDLLLSGHTHGGQVRIPFIGTPLVPSKFGQRYAGGLIQHPRFPVVVSRGVGLSLLPVRIGVPPELTLIELTRA